MRHKDIERLLERYMDGLTTLDEERRLARYFRTHDVPAEWQGYKAMFEYIEREFAPRPKRRSLIPLVWSVAAAAAAVLVITLLLPSPGQESAFPPVLAEVEDSIHTDELKLSPEIAPASIMRRRKAQPDTSGTRRLIVPSTPEDKQLRTIPFLRLNIVPKHYLAEIAIQPSANENEAVDAHLNALAQIEADIDKMLQQADYSVAIDNALDEEY